MHILHNTEIERIFPNLRLFIILCYEFVFKEVIIKTFSVQIDSLSLYCMQLNMDNVIFLNSMWDVTIRTHTMEAK